jgi:hypothetical protein
MFLENKMKEKEMGLHAVGLGQKCMGNYSWKV